MTDPSSSLDLQATSAGDTADPELLSLPRPPRRARTISLVLLGATAILTLAMTLNMLGEARYSLNADVPQEVGDLGRLAPTEALHNRFVHGTGALGSTGVMRYERPLERDSFRLAPVAGNDKIWVEMRVPPDGNAPEAVPPTAFVGRLLPVDGAGFAYRGLRRSVHEVTGAVMPPNSWLLVDGATPAASRWTAPLAALFALFAVWNLVSIARIVRPVRG
jgi:hypothetical protein